jgi:hypothetical protein
LNIAFLSTLPEVFRGPENYPVRHKKRFAIPRVISSMFHVKHFWPKSMLLTPPRAFAKTRLLRFQCSIDSMLW